MKFKLIAGCFLLAQVVLGSGCIALTRLTAAPTVDGLGNLGADVRLSFTPAAIGLVPAKVEGWLGVDFGVGGGYWGTERIGAAQLRITPELAVPAKPGFVRMGIGYSGRYSGQVSCSVTTRAAAQLNGLIAYVALDVPLLYREQSSGPLRAIYLGPELTGETLFTAGPCVIPNRGVFSLGLSLAVLLQL